jgi:DNA-binding SARP family transcriptional activator
MATLRIRLFGRFCLEQEDRVAEPLERSKATELFSYLLLYPDRAHPRETLAALLWESSTTSQSKKYLRQALWQLGSVLHSRIGYTVAPPLRVEAEWVSLDRQTDIWVDVAAFEKQYTLAQGVPGPEFEREQVEAVKTAVDYYTGDLLEDCYWDWCLEHRERLRNMYLGMLDKLAGYYESRGDYEAGLLCGARILHQDRARERTHRQLMRLYYLAGDRTAALRQYESCAAALDDELAVEPARSTRSLYEQICADKLNGASSQPAGTLAPLDTPVVEARPPDALGLLKAVQATLADIQHRLGSDIQVIEQHLNDSR